MIKSLMKKTLLSKKRISILLCMILAFTLLAACSGAPAGFSPNDSSMLRLTGSSDNYAPVPASIEMPMAVADSGTYIMNDAIEYEWADEDYISYSHGETAGGSTTANITAPVREGLAEKIIYSVYADIETLNFDESIESVHALLNAYDAFIEHSSISGINYVARHHGWNEYRYASFTIRVPVQNLNAVTGNLSHIGNVVHQSSSADNITSQFIDTQSRLNSLTIQEERLLDMLSRAEDVPDLISIEERLSEVRYQIEWMTTMLNNWQRQVDYSNVTMSIREVEIYTEPTELYRSYWQQISDGFMATLRSIGRFFMNLFMWIIVAAPVLVILAVIAVVILLIIRKKMRSYEVKRKASYEAAQQAVNLPEQIQPPENKE